MPTDIADALRELVRDVVREVLAEEREARSSGAELLTTAEASAVAKVKPATIRSWIRLGQLRATKVGRSLRVSRAELDAALSQASRRGKETVLGPAERGRRNALRIVENRDGNR